jgi:hypothetical protein
MAEYVYAGGTSNQSVIKYDTDFNILAISPNYGGSIRAITTDDNYVYYSGSSTDKVRKAYKGNLTTITDSPSYGGTIASIKIDDDYVYYGGSSTDKVRKAYKGNLTTITDSPDYGGTIYSITTDDNYVYYCGHSTNKVRKAYKGSLNTITDSPSYGGTIISITTDDDYVYYCGETTETVRKAYKGNLTTITDSPSYDGKIRAITTDDDYVYYGGEDTDKVRKAYKGNLTTITDSPSYDGTIRSITTDDDYVYYGGDTPKTVRKAYKGNLTTITDSPSYGGSIWAIDLEEEPNSLTINSISPVDEYNSSSSSVDFECNATDETGVYSLNLTINGTVYETVTGDGTTNLTLSSTETLNEGYWEWYCTGNDDTETLNSTTRHLTVDATPPSITATLNETIIYAEGDVVEMSYNITDENLDTCWYDYNNTETVITCGEDLTEDITTTNDELTITVYANDTAGNENNYTLDMTLEDVAPTINVTSPIESYDYLYDTIDLNYSINDTNLDSCWYEYNGTNNTLNCSENTTFNYIAGIDELTVYANDTVGNENSELVSWDYKVLESEINFEEEVLEGTEQEFEIILVPGTENVRSVTLYYDGQVDVASLVSSGGIVTATSTLFIPQVTSDTNNIFYFQIETTDSEYFNSTSNNQSVLNIDIDNCSVNTYEIITLLLKDEGNKSSISGDIETNLQILNDETYSQVLNFSQSSLNVSSDDVCSNVNLSETDFLLDAEIRYSSDNYSREFYHIQKAELSDYPLNLSLFDLKTEDTTRFKVIYRNEDLIGVSGAIIQLQRKYISEGIYEIVEAPLTSTDSDAVVHIDTNTNKYQITVVKDGVVLGIFTDLAFICESELTGECTLDLFGTITPSTLTNIATLQDFSYSLESSIENLTIDLTYTIPSGSSSEVQVLAVKKDTITGESTICNTTLISAAGSIECAYSGSIQDSVVEYQVYKDGELLVQKGYLIQENSISDFGGINYWIVVILMLSLVFMALSSPEWIVINAVVTVLLAGGIWLIRGIGFVDGLGSLMWLIVAAVILISKLSRQEDF